MWIFCASKKLIKSWAQGANCLEWGAKRFMKLTPDLIYLACKKKPLKFSDPIFPTRVTWYSMLLLLLLFNLTWSESKHEMEKANTNYQGKIKTK